MLPRTPACPRTSWFRCLLAPVPRNCAPLPGRTSTWTALCRASWSGARSAPAATPRPGSHAVLSSYRSAASIRSFFTAKGKARSVHGVGIGGMTMIWCSPRAWVPHSTRGMSAARSARSPLLRILTLPSGRRVSCGTASSRCVRRGRPGREDRPPGRPHRDRHNRAGIPQADPARRHGWGCGHGPVVPQAGRRCLVTQLVTQSRKAMTPVRMSWPLSWWGYQDLNLGPLPYQGSALTV